MLNKQLSIPITQDVVLLIYSERDDVYYDENAINRGESCWQLEEGKQYEYEFTNLSSRENANDWFLEGPDRLFTPNPLHNCRGKISTGIYVGTVTFQAKKTHSSDTISVIIEIRSVKVGYREHYRHMLNDIAHYYADLVMLQGAPVTQKFDVDYDTPQETLYQKFAFVKSIVEEEQFDEAIHKIVSNPVRRWTNSEAEKHIESVRRLSRTGMRQLASRANRVPINNNIHSLGSLPRFITVNQKIDSIDTSENQFVKYILTSLYGFCSNLGTKKHANNRLKTEIKVVCNRLENHLHSAFFKEISMPSRLNLGSPVLQRKEGYREIMQAWLLFDLSAKLAWKGGDNVYSAGKKNVAVLYEYWLFFKLMECVSEIFTIPAAEKSALVSLDDDHINLSIRQGKTAMVEGQMQTQNRLLNVCLYYNRTFGYKDNDHRSSAGSWTMNMRPDYTLTIWPGEMTDVEAEKKDAIVYIHFDAKYRLDKILIDDKEVDEETLEKQFEQEKEDREKDIYKRGDLLKMHAYKDAIRRTAGAYVLYPGDNSSESKVLKGYHEIIPGMGAFPIAPGHEDEQLPALKSFLLSVVEHFMNRTSQREKMAIVGHQIHNEITPPFYGPFPEPFDYGSFPDTVKVLIGYYKNDEHLRWILNNRKYNIRIGGVRDRSIKLSESYLEAKYLLLYNRKDVHVRSVLKISDVSHPIIISDSELFEMGYPHPTQGQMYMLYEVSEDRVEPELHHREWAIQSFVKNNNFAPVIVTYTKLFAGHDAWSDSNIQVI